MRDMAGRVKNSIESPHPLSWRSRSLRALALLVLLMLALRLAWGWHAARKLSRQLADLQRAGHPIRLEDLTFAPVNNQENAWLLHTQAAAALTAIQSPGYSNLEFRDYPPYPPAWMKMAEASETAHRQSFALARQARALPRAALRARVISLANIMTPGFTQARHLATTIADGATYSHLRGDDAEAIERVRDVLHIARALRHDEILVSQLVAIGIDGVAIHRAQIIAPGLRLEKDSPARQKVRELIAELLDESDEWTSFERAILNERVFGLDDLHSRSRGQWLIRPLADQSADRFNRIMDVTVEAARLRTWPAARRVLDRRPLERSVEVTLTFLSNRPRDPVVPRYSRWYQIWYGDLARSIQIQFRLMSDRRATAVSLAAQLFRADHGRWPNSLAELVPHYLNALPADPWHDDGRPLGYELRKVPGGAAADRPLVYIDVGPGDVVLPAEPVYDWSTPRGKDGKQIPDGRQYRDLSRFTPPPSPPETVDDDPDKPNTPGDQPEKDDGRQ